MSQPGSCPNETGLEQNGDATCRNSVLTDTHGAAETPEASLLSSFKTDTHKSKVYLAGKGESSHPRSINGAQVLDRTWGLYGEGEKDFPA